MEFFLIFPLKTELNAQPPEIQIIFELVFFVNNLFFLKLFPQILFEQMQLNSYEIDLFFFPDFFLIFLTVSQYSDYTNPQKKECRSQNCNLLSYCDDQNILD